MSLFFSSKKKKVTSEEEEVICAKKSKKSWIRGLGSTLPSPYCLLPAAALPLTYHFTLMLAAGHKSNKSKSPKSNSRGVTFFVTVAILTFIFFDICLTLSRSRYFQRITPFLQSVVHRPGSDGTFAQNYQDTWFLRLAKRNGWDRPGETNGFFLDLGAYHGVWCSNTKLLEEKLPDWNGACVDFEPDSFQGRKCKVFRNAMAGVSGKSVTYSGGGQLRTMAPAASNDFFQLKTINFPDILEQSHAPSSFIHFISLDVEGHELDVLQSFEFDKYQVGAWIIENSTRDKRWDSIVKLLEEHGYKFRQVNNRGVDGYFVMDTFWDDTMLEKEWRTHPLGSWGC